MLVGLGFAETYTPSPAARRPDPDALRLPEPISAELAVLRTSLLPSLVDGGRRNVELGARASRCSRSRASTCRAASLPDERAARRRRSSRAGSPRARASSRRSTRALKAEPRFDRGERRAPPSRARPRASPPASSASCTRALLDGDWGAFELDLERLFDDARDAVSYADVITYPAVHQDLAFIVAEDVPPATSSRAAREAAGHELREMRVFDVYRGPQVGEGRKSVAFSVTFQSPERTLADEDAARLRDRDRRRRCASASAPSSGRKRAHSGPRTPEVGSEGRP